MEQVNLIQGSPEWLAHRRDHYNASDAAAMLGLDKKTSRNELIRLYATGSVKEFSEYVQTKVLDKGHEVEALARPIIEQMIGEELFPVTGTLGELSASFDGITMLDTICFEHKQWNEELANLVRQGVVPDSHMPQPQQQLMVSKAEKVIFVVSDGTPEKMVYTEVFPDATWFARIEAGWAQFKKDVAEYVPAEIVAAPVGQAPEDLPALFIEVTGMVKSSNLDKFKEHALTVFDGIKTELTTDEDFADADKTAKWCGEVESRLDAAKQHALGQTQSIDELFRTIDQIKEMARQKRLALEKLVTQRKAAIKDEKILAAKKKWAAHLEDLQAEIKQVRLIVKEPDFAVSIKGLKTLLSVQNALDTALSNGKIEADATAKDLRAKLEWCRENAAGHSALVPDLQQIIVKPMDDFVLTISSRIDQHKKAEAARLEAERERIRQEEAAKLAAAQAQAQERANAAADVTQPVAQPAPPPAVQTLARVPALTAKEAVPQSPPTLRLGTINERLGFTVNAEFLSTLGFEAHVDRNARLYRESDFPLICRAIAQHVQSVALGLAA